MKARRPKTLLALAALVIAPGACAMKARGPVDGYPTMSVGAPTIEGQTFAEETWRRDPPAPGTPVPFAPPKVEEARLSNGLRVLYAERRGLPIVAVSFTSLRGASEAKPGIGSFAAAMLVQGTKTRSALQISDELERLGAIISPGADYDYAEVRLQTLKANLEGALDLFADIATRPRFEPAEIERERSKRLTAIAQQRDSAGAQLQLAMADVLYPEGHPYASTLLGTREAVQAATPAALRAFWETVARPDRVVLSVAGDLSKDEAVAALEKAFGAWKASGPAPTAASPKPAGASKTVERIVLVDRPGAPQSNVALGLVAMPRKTRDFEAALVLNAVLGGQFSSRMNMNLREQKGISYGVRSSFDFRHDPGPFTAGGAVQTEPTEIAVRELLKEVGRIRDAAVTDDELEDAKKDLIQGLPSRFETALGTAVALSGLAIYDLPLDEYAARPARIQRVSKEDVRRVAQAYLKPDMLRVVVVGDAAVVKPGLEKIGFGAVQTRKPVPDDDAKDAAPKARGKGASAAPTGEAPGAAATQPTKKVDAKGATPASPARGAAKPAQGAVKKAP